MLDEAFPVNWNELWSQGTGQEFCFRYVEYLQAVRQVQLYLAEVQAIKLEKSSDVVTKTLKLDIIT